MDLRRDPNIPLRIQPYNSVPIDLSIDIQVEDNYLQSKVKKDVEQALSPGRHHMELMVSFLLND